MNQIVAVTLTASGARRNCSTGVQHKDRTLAAELGANMATEGTVAMAGQQKMHVHARQFRHGGGCPQGKLEPLAARCRQWVVGDESLEHRGRKPAECTAHLCNLLE